LNSFNAKQDAKECSMPFELQTTADGVKLVLAGRLGVQQARSLWDALQPVIAANQSIRLQAEELDEMDTSIIQILCRLNNRTGQFQIDATSDGFVAALKGRGLATFFVPQSLVSPSFVSPSFVSPSVEPPPAEPETQTPPLQPEIELETLANAARQGHD
jgi:ABC-type transporter Mla MlaB component